MERTELNANVNEEMQEEYIGEHISVIDFKMITFSLAEKDYAIDIMKVCTEYRAVCTGGV